MGLNHSDITFDSDGLRCAATLYLPPDLATPVPCVVIGPGGTLTRKDGIPSYAERFASAGFAALAFDYRHWGESDGQPRRWISIDRQLHDWRAAVRWAREHHRVDPRRIVLSGMSLGGGHALLTAAAEPEIAAVIALVPVVDGLALLRKHTLGVALRMTATTIFRTLTRRAVMLPVAGPPRSLAVLSESEALPGFERVASANGWRNEADVTGTMLPFVRGSAIQPSCRPRRRHLHRTCSTRSPDEHLASPVTASAGSGSTRSASGSRCLRHQTSIINQVPVNVEIKAKDEDPQRSLRLALAANAQEAGILQQTDTYFHVSNGRLKLREQSGPTGREAWLIPYSRADEAVARASTYDLVPIEHPVRLKEALAATLRIQVIVSKRRRLLLWEGVRIHLDEVDHLGSFVEIEAIASHPTDLKQGHALVEELMRLLHIDPSQVVSFSYSDALLLSSADRTRG